jgi:hypothetical protein
VASDLLPIFLYLAIFLAGTPLLGGYMAVFLLAGMTIIFVLATATIPVDERTEGRAFGLIGARRVNVLLINIGLDRMAKDRVRRVVDEDG